MTNEPLEPVFRGGRTRPDAFAAHSTGCWRGYVGTWDLRDGALILVSLKTEPRLGARGAYSSKPIPLSAVFPEQEHPVPAEWYSGVLEAWRIDEEWLDEGALPTADVVFISIVKGKEVGRMGLRHEGASGIARSDSAWSKLRVSTASSASHSVEEATEWENFELWDQSTLFAAPTLQDPPTVNGFEDLMRTGRRVRLRGLYFGDSLWLPHLRGLYGSICPVAYRCTAPAPALASAVEVVVTLERRSERDPVAWYRFVIEGVRLLGPEEPLTRSPVMEPGASDSKASQLGTK